MKNADLALEWLNLALSNLERANLGKQNESIYYEDLCFDCQQSVKKSFKAILIFNQIEFPYVHSISKLLEIIEAHGITIPNIIRDSVILSEYAVETRYPGDYEPVDIEEYLTALKIAKFIYEWVSGIIK
jgi:HEPN domain-containing protein